MYLHLSTSCLNTEVLVQSVVFLYQVELKRQCCGTSAPEVYEHGGDKGESLWAVGPVPQMFRPKVESHFAVLLVMGEDKS